MRIFRKGAALRRIRKAAMEGIRAEIKYDKAAGLLDSGGSAVDPAIAVREADQGIRQAVTEEMNAQRDARALILRGNWRIDRWLGRVNRVAREARRRAERELRSSR